MWNKFLDVAGFIGGAFVLIGVGGLIATFGFGPSLAVTVGGMVLGGTVWLGKKVFSNSSSSKDEQKKELINDKMAELDTFKDRRVEDGNKYLKQESMSYSQVLSEFNKLKEQNAKLTKENQDQALLNKKFNAEIEDLKQTVSNMGRDVSNVAITQEKQIRQKQPSIFAPDIANPSVSGLNANPKV